MRSLNYWIFLLNENQARFCMKHLTTNSALPNKLTQTQNPVLLQQHEATRENHSPG